MPGCPLPIHEVTKRQCTYSMYCIRKHEILWTVVLTCLKLPLVLSKFCKDSTHKFLNHLKKKNGINHLWVIITDPPADNSLHFPKISKTTRHEIKNPDELDKKMRAATELGLKNSQLTGEQGSFSAHSSASHFNRMLRVAGSAVSPVSVLNDSWMIYQVASGSSVGHHTWAECKKERPPGNGKGCLQDVWSVSRWFDREQCDAKGENYLQNYKQGYSLSVKGCLTGRRIVHFCLSQFNLSLLTQGNGIFRFKNKT